MEGPKVLVFMSFGLFKEKDISGELFVDEWIGFGPNKTLMMERAKGKADYILHFDADDILMGDFESIAHNFVFKMDRKKFTIFSNIPYGESQEMSEKVQIRSLYKRIGKFLRKYTNFIDDVFILVKKRSKQDDLNFHNLTEIKWKEISTFYNNGIEVEFLQMEKKEISNNIH